MLLIDLLCAGLLLFSSPIKGGRTRRLFLPHHTIRTFLVWSFQAVRSGEIQFNSEYLVGFKRGFDRKQVLREVYEVRTHKLYASSPITKHGWCILRNTPKPSSMCAATPRDFIQWKDCPGTRMAIKKSTAMIPKPCYTETSKATQKNVDRGYHSLYLGHIPAFAKHVKGMPSKSVKTAGWALMSNIFHDPLWSQRSTKLRLVPARLAVKVDKPGFDAALQDVIKETWLITDIGETELEAWKNLLTLFMF